MKTLQIFLGTGVIIALLVFLNVATADVSNESLKEAKKSLTFTVDVGDGSVGMPEVKFAPEDGEQSQGTCAMTPGGNMPNMLLGEPVLPTPKQDMLQNTPDKALEPLSSLKTPPPYHEPYRRRDRQPPDRDPDPDPNDPDPNDPDPPPNTTPEPATLLLVGLGVGVALCETRRRRGKP